ncbi:MAG: class I SAM-dependent methyltransferase [Armatimonadaceae bacterium]
MNNTIPNGSLTWDNRFRQNPDLYGREPNVFFRDKLAELKPGKLLLPCEGEGRNAVWAAKQGWAVFAFDYSRVARTAALKRAAEANVNIHYALANPRNYGFPGAPYNGAALIYAHLPMPERRLLIEGIGQRLKKDGLIIVEAFSPRQLAAGNPSGGPRTEELLYTVEDTQSLFADFDILELEETEVTLHEGAGHEGIGYVVRCVARC